MDTYSITSQPPTPLPPDDMSRNLVVADADTEQSLPHIGMVGDTYTVLLSGNDTNGRYCLFDMLIPPGGGPAPHRHDFEETFIITQGEAVATFRGQKTTLKAGQTAHVPADSPHEFHNESDQPLRLFCICGPSGQEDFFEAIGVPLATRTTPAPTDAATKAAFMTKMLELAPVYLTVPLTTTDEP